MAEIAHGTIGVDLDQSKAIAELKRLKAEFERTMRDIDRQKANAEIDADIAPLEDSIRNAKRQLKILEATDTEVEIDGDNSGLKEAIAEARADIKRFEAQKATIELEVKGQEKALAQIAAVQKAEDARARAQDKHARALEKNEAEQSKRKLRLIQLEKDHAKAVREVEKTQRKQVSDLGRRPRGVSRMEAKVELDIDKRLALEKLAAIKREMNILGGHPPVEISVDVDRKGAVRDFLHDSLDRVKGWGKSLQDLRINLGPITTSLRGLAVGLSLFGPVILGLIGSLGALVASLGAAAAGAGAVGLAMVGGFVPAVLGGILVVKPMVAQLQAVHKAQTKYNDAVLKYGKDSKQAHDATKQLNQTLKGVDSTTREAVKNSSNLSTRWNEITKPARAAAWKVVGQALKTASADLDTFGRGTNKTFGAASKAVTGWLKGLRSGEAKNILGDLMGNFAKAIGPAAKGVGALVTALGRIGRVASGFLPGLMRGFQQWAQSIADGTKNTSKLRSNIAKMIDSMRSWGHLLQSTGRFLASFFGAGVSAGDDLVQSLTKVIDGWTRFNQSVSGKAKLGQFFADAATNTKAFFSAMAPLASMFVTWTAQMMPFVSGLLQGASAVGKMVASLTQLVGLTGGIKDLGVVLGALFAIKRIGAIGRLLGLGGGAAGGGAAGGAAAGGAVANLTRLRGVATKLVPALAGLGAISGGAATLGLAALAGAAAYGVYKLVTMKSAGDKLKESIDNTNKATQQIVPHTQDYLAAVDQASRDTKSYADSVGAVADAKKRLSKLEAEGKTNTDAYREQTQKLRDALQQRAVNEDAVRKAQARQVGLSGKVLADSLSQTKATNDVAKAEDALAKARQPGAASRNPQGIAAAEKQLTDARNAQAKAAKAVEASQNRMAAGAAVVARATRGMIPLTEAATASIGRLARAAPKTAIKIATKFEDPKDAGRVAANANRALKAGVSSKQVVKIVADSSNAEQAIARLKAIRLEPKTLRTIEQGGDAAIAKLRQIKGTKLTPHESRTVERGGAGALAMLAKVAGIKIPAKLAAIIARDNASGVIRGVIGLLNSVQNKTITLTTIHRTIGGGLISGAGHKARPAGPRPAAASGRHSGRHTTALVGEGLGPEILANSKTGAMGVVRQPTITALSADDWVIPTESRYRSRGRDLFAQFAKSMGIPGFKGGKGQKSLSENARAKARAQARTHVPKFKAYASDNIKELPGVEKAKQREEDQNREISIYESTMKEPESFLRKEGEDAEGNTIYSINQDAINNWAGQLNKLAGMYDTLVTRIQEVQNAVNIAMDAVHSVIKRASHNIHHLNILADRERSTITNKHSSKHERQRAKERLGVYEDAINNEVESRRNARSDEASLKEDAHDAPYRITEAQINAGEARSDAAAIQGKAEADLESSIPKTKADAAAEPAGPFDALNLAGQKLDAESALTAIGQGTMSATDITAAQIANNQSIINTAKGLLADSDPTNDEAAYSAITSAAGAIQNLQGNQQPIATQMNNLSGAVGTLLTGMGSNFSNGTTAASLMKSSAVAAAGPQLPAPGPTGQQAPTGRTIQVINNYQTQPIDPHTWSRNVLFELQAAG